jgi:glycosyltransferase involved in cell wall biosynthesis
MLNKPRADGRIPLLYLAPWVDFGGTDTSTIDWFRWIDRSRFAPSLITTQPSPNRRLAEVVPYADEVWALPDFMPGQSFPAFILDFVQKREIGLVHIMNSRLGFNLIPDLKCLSPSPAVVVQLHVEEPDRSGYVRYVATHYGNLVDGFSLSSEHLSRAIQDYEVPASKCHVIYTGVDAALAFAPERFRKRIPVPKTAFSILYCGRLCDQKDPLLMVEVCAELRNRGRDFRVHVLGDGPLEEEVRAAVSHAGLDDKILFHGTDAELAPWYACCDLMLLTSVFEGIPIVVYDAMAMAVPTVAPALPGIVELLDDTGGVLIAPRHEVSAYADAVERIMDNPGLARDLGERARQRVLEDFSLEKMGREHGYLYERLLPARPTPTDDQTFPGELLMRTRPVRGKPLVSVVIPCFQHGSFLLECIGSVMAQTYPNIEIVIVDDASDDEATCFVLDDLARRPNVSVIRLTENMGPGVARQRGIDEARGRYILPVDADNRLTEDAVASLVLQLQESGERVGFIYPNQTFFGMRNDAATSPSYNLDLLLENNYCDTSCLIDREIFTAGVRYGDDLRWVHEDWDFTLALAERGVRGAPARGRFLEVRKSGFTRSDLLNRAARSEATLRGRHPALYGHRMAVKSRWSPALSIIAADPVDDREEARGRLRRGLLAQTCTDAELILRDDAWWPRNDAGPCVRRVAASHDESAGAAIATGLGIARGKYLMVVRGFYDQLFLDCAFIEKTLRLLSGEAATGGPVGFLRREDAVPAFAPLGSDLTDGETPVGVAWPVSLMGDHAVAVVDADPLASICAALTHVTGSQVSWRQLPLSQSRRGVESGSTRRSPARVAHLAGGGQQAMTEGERIERYARLSRPPLLEEQSVSDPRARDVDSWHPALTRVLYRHIHDSGSSYTVTFDQTPPAHYVFDYALGSLSTCGQNGAPELVLCDGPDYRTVPANDVRRQDEHLLGYLEAVPFALLDSLFVACHRVTGRQVLVAGDDDPLLADVDLTAHLGFIEPDPLRPRTRSLGTHEAAVIRELARLRAPLGHELGRDRRVAHQVAMRLAKYPTVYSLARRAYRLIPSPDRAKRSR